MKKLVLGVLVLAGGIHHIILGGDIEAYGLEEDPYSVLSQTLLNNDEHEAVPKTFSEKYLAMRTQSIDGPTLAMEGKSRSALHSDHFEIPIEVMRHDNSLVRNTVVQQHGRVTECKDEVERLKREKLLWQLTGVFSAGCGLPATACAATTLSAGTVLFLIYIGVLHV